MTATSFVAWRIAVLRPLEPLALREQQQVTVSVSDHDEEVALVDAGFLAYLETEVANGRIRYYGVSSNSFPDARESSPQP